MAKKKKKRSTRGGGGGDARGYSTRSTAANATIERIAGSAAKKVEVTTKAHEGLTNLLGELASTTTATTVTTTDVGGTSVGAVEGESSESKYGGVASSSTTTGRTGVERDDGTTHEDGESSASVRRPNSSFTVPTTWNKKDEDDYGGGSGDGVNRTKKRSTTSSSSSLSSSHPIDTSSARFLKKVTNLHDKLTELGFEERDTECVIREMTRFSRGAAAGGQAGARARAASAGVDLTLDLALDWLCLNLTADRLPPLFAETSIRVSALGGDEGDIYVVKADVGRVWDGSDSGSGDGAAPGDRLAAAEDLSRAMERNLALRRKGQGDGEGEGDEDRPTRGEGGSCDGGEEGREKGVGVGVGVGGEARAWLLRQYQYVDDSDDDTSRRNAEGGKEDQSGGDRGVAGACAGEGVENDEDDDDECHMTPQERQLAGLEKQIAEDRATLGDDVANYMRTKHEVSELKKRLKRAEAQARKLRAKVAEIRSARVTEIDPVDPRESAKEKDAKDPLSAKQTDAAAEGQEKDNNNDDDDDDDVIGEPLSSLFDDNNDIGNGKDEKEKDKTGTNAVPPCLPLSVVPTKKKEDSVVSAFISETKTGPGYTEPSIPKNWTGKTPKEILEDWCKKRKLPRPKFNKLPQTTNGCRIVFHAEVEQPQTRKGKAQEKGMAEKTLTLERPGPFYSFADAQYFLSTEALYELNPTLPLYRIFPPAFRDLWKSWMDKVAAEKVETIRSKQQKKEEKMKSFVRSIQDEETFKSTSAPRKSMTSENSGGLDKEERRRVPSSGEAPDDVPDYWDDEDDDDDDDGNDDVGVEAGTDKLAGQADAPITPIGERLREEFLRQQSLERYARMAKERGSLPMSSHRDALLDAVRRNQVTVLCAQTGAGKTTQCPQFLLEDALLSSRGDRVNIVCTQPRRISAISVAERVADEMCESIGHNVGYHIRGETRRSNRTKLMFCTTGVVLRRLQDDPTLAGVTHVVIDEVHERQWQIDFLLIVIRQLIRTTRKDLKVILMSATLDSQLFCSFFHGAPFLSIPGRTYPVTEYHLEDLLDATGHVIEEGSRYALRRESKGDYASLWITGRGGEKRRQVVSLEAAQSTADLSNDYAGYGVATRISMDRVNEEIINYDLIEDVLSLLLIDSDRGELRLPEIGEGDCIIDNAAVLVFLPGLGEIRTLSERLKGSYKFGSRQKFDIIPMHSTLSPKDQRRAFSKPRDGCRKIILATNICETSITIPDVAYVIDSGLVREVRINKRTGTSTLVTGWCSKASAKQRSGRAGRVQAGICCKLYSSKAADRMKDQSMPELQRVPLEEVCLSILAAKMSSNCMDFLLQAPEPPEEGAVQKALKLLAEVGAIYEYSPTSLVRIERLTPLGNHLAKLPVHVRLGKMLIFGALFRCLDKVLTIAASLSCSKSVFATSLDDAQQSASQKTFFHPTSDFLTICNVWDTYSAELKENSSKGVSFCERFFLNRTSLMEIGDLRRQFLSLLEQIGFVRDSREGDSKRIEGPDLGEYNANGNRESIVSAVVCAGLYPNIAHAINATGGGVPELWHGSERLHFHSSSVNHKKTRLDSEWVAFYEKFATSRVYISATSLVKPFSILLFGRSLVVKPMDRKVIVDDWIELNIAAQTGIMFRELRHEVDGLLKEMIENVDGRHEKGNRMIRGIAKLLGSE